MSTLALPSERLSDTYFSHPVTKGPSDTGAGDSMSQPMLNIGVWVGELESQKSSEQRTRL